MAFQNGDLIVVNRNGIDYKALIDDLIAGGGGGGSAGDGAINIEGGDGISATGSNATANQSTDTTRTLTVKTGSGIIIDGNGNVIIDPNFNIGTEDHGIGDGAIAFNAGAGLAQTGTNATANQLGDTAKTFSVKTASGITIDANGNVIIDPNFNLDGNITDPGDGAIAFNAGAGLAESGTNATANQTGDTAKTFSVKTSDGIIIDGSGNIIIDPNFNLDGNITPPGNGNININGGDGLSASGSNGKANQTGDTTRTLAVKTGPGIIIDGNGDVAIDPSFNLDGNVTAPNDGKLTIKDEDDNVLGEFTANQAGDSEVVIPAGGGGDLDCAGLVDCFNNAPVDPLRFALALNTVREYYYDPNDQPENWPEDQQDHIMYLYANLCDPVTHEIIPFDQEGHGHSGLDGSIFRLPHGYYYNGNLVVTPCPPISYLEDQEEAYGVHPPKLILEDLKVFTDRYEKGTTTTEDLFTTGDEYSNRWGEISSNGDSIYFYQLKCDSWPGGPNGPNYGGYECRSDDFEDGGKYFFRLEFKYNLEPYKMVIILNHDRKPIPGGNSVTTIVNFELPNIPIKPMEDN